MKKRWCGILVFCLLGISFFCVYAEAQNNVEGPGELYARSAVLMDADSGRVLFGKEERVVRPMASTTKIMTCILALEKMKPGQIVEVSRCAAHQPKVHLGVKENERFYLKDLLYSLMLESHNDSAVMVAEGISGTVEKFADLMNEKAEKLGCKDTHFVTPNGLDGSDKEGIHSTTAEDLARIMRYCIVESPCKEEFLEITRMNAYQFSDVDGKRSFSCNNHNAFLNMMEGALTGKTGFTGEAGYCYVGALERDGRTFIVALLACGWPNNKDYKWKDTKKLMEYGIQNYTYQSFNTDIKLPEVQVKGGVSLQNPYQMDGTVAVGIKRVEKEVLLKKGEKIDVIKEMPPVIRAPVKKKKIIGRVFFLVEGEEIISCPVVTKHAVKERTVKWCIMQITRRVCL